MRKIVVDFPKLGKTEFSIQGKTVRVYKYISLENQRILISNYLEIYFDLDSEGLLAGATSNRFAADVMWDIVLLDIMTNVKIDSKQIHMDELYASGFMSKITDKISNYSEVVKKREEILEDVIREQNSISTLLTNLISDISALDFDALNNLKDNVVKVQEDISNSAISSLMDEAKDVLSDEES